MRYVVTVAALILSYAPTASYAQQAYVSAPGTHSCGKYLEAVHGPCTWESQANSSSSRGAIFG